MAKKFALGIDPGFTETGLVLRLDGQKKRVLDHKVLSCPSKIKTLLNGTAMTRTFALCDEIFHYIYSWCEQYSIIYLDIVMERPIYNGNPDSFEKQWRLFQAIQTELPDLNMLLRNVPLVECWITEVMPSTSKKLATGDGKAGKARVARASPFLREDFATTDTWQTLGDAWSHSLAAWGDRHYARVDLNNLTMPVVKKIV